MASPNPAGRWLARGGAGAPSSRGAVLHGAKSASASRAGSSGPMTRLVQRLAQGPGQQAAHATGIAEAHLGLGRVHVDVDLARRHRHEQRQQRVARLGDQVAVGRAHGADQQPVLHRPAVDEQVLLTGDRADAASAARQSR